jgi:hypothetical protein
VTDRLEIGVRYEGPDRIFDRATLEIPRPFSLDSNQLDLVMAICNRHFGDPDKFIGGPELPPAPPPERRKRKDER